MALKIKARKVAQGKKGKKKTWLTVEDVINQIAEGSYAQRDLVNVLDQFEGSTSRKDFEAVMSSDPEYAAAIFYSTTLSDYRPSPAEIGILTDGADTASDKELVSALDFARKYREQEFAGFYMPKYGSAWKKAAAEELADSAKAYKEAKKLFKI